MSSPTGANIKGQQTLICIHLCVNPVMADRRLLCRLLGALTDPLPTPLFLLSPPLSLPLPSPPASFFLPLPSVLSSNPWLSFFLSFSLSLFQFLICAFVSGLFIGCWPAVKWMTIRTSFDSIAPFSRVSDFRQ